jgi:hypothetical protein
MIRPAFAALALALAAPLPADAQEEIICDGEGYDEFWCDGPPLPPPAPSSVPFGVGPPPSGVGSIAGNVGAFPSSGSEAPADPGNPPPF